MYCNGGVIVINKLYSVAGREPEFIWEREWSRGNEREQPNVYQMQT